MAIVHSYSRFSDPSQAMGDSLRRQQESAAAWCKKQGHQLSDLRFQDLGKSGWRGNKQKALDAFLKAIEDGRVQPGEILLVEAVDRLSRKGVRATQTLVNRILNGGVSIAILSPIEKVYSADDHNDIGGAIELSAFAYQASVYSENLSRRIKAATETHRRKVKAGDRKLWSPVAPAWLKWNPAKERWEQRPEVVEAIKYIFKRTIAGVGRVRLVQELNEKFEPPGGRSNSIGWNGQYVGRLLKTRMAIGEFKSSVTGETLTDYYPAIITEAQWLKANAANAGRRSKRGPEEQHLNIFGGLLYSARDRSAYGYHLSIKSQKKLDGGRLVNRRYQSWATTTGMPEADRGSFNVERFEELLFALLPKVQLSPGKSESAILEGERQYLQSEIDTIQQQITSRAGGAIILGPVLLELGRQLEKVEAKIREQGTVVVQPTVAYRKKLSAMLRGTSQERERVRDAVRAIVRRIEVLPIKLGPNRWDRVRCVIEVEFRNGEFARGIELESGEVAVMRGSEIKTRLSEQVQSGWDLTASDYIKLVKVLG
ncbi:MAG: recombinase family protein [Planctomycetaceae bacterium]|nr:recombinase family protein [Planctomycetaceae bacterium]